VPRYQEFDLVRYDAEEPELYIDGEQWRVGPCMYAHPGETEGLVERLSDGHWAVGAGRLIRSVFGRGPIPFTGRVPAAGHIATPPTAFLSREDDARLRARQHARLVVKGKWVPGSRDRNVLATLPGEIPEKVVVGAHYDSVWRGNGAIDNATGVEGLLRVARHFVSRRPRRSLEFVAFGAEEIGLVGARRYVAEARERGLVGEIAAMINLDCIGHGEKLQLLSTSQPLLEDAQRAASNCGAADRYPVTTTLGGDAGTDHVPFADAGVPALSILHFPYEEYHLPDESLELVDEQRLEDAVTIAISVVETALER
jgi:aminopeptidase YwaD